MVNPRPRREINSHDIVFDDDMTEPLLVEYKTNVHNVDTTIEELTVMQMQQSSTAGPCKVMMNASTWHSLTQDDQQAWDKISDDTKCKILEYAMS